MTNEEHVKNVFKKTPLGGPNWIGSVMLALLKSDGTPYNYKNFADGLGDWDESSERARFRALEL